MRLSFEKLKRSLAELPTRGRTGRVVAAIGTGSITWLMNTVTMIAVTPIFLNQFSPEGYGVWLFLLSVVALLGLGDIRIGAAIVPHAIKYVAAGDNVALHGLYSAALTLRALLCAFFVVTVALLAPLLLQGGDTELANEQLALQTLWLLAASVVVRWIGTVFESMVIARQAEYRLVWANISRSTLAPLMGTILVFGVGDIRALGIGYLFASCLALILQFREFRLQFAKVSVWPSKPQKVMIEKVGALSLWFAADGLAAAAFVNLDKVIIQATLGPEAVTEYVITWFLFVTIYQAVSRLASVATAGIGDVLARRESSRASEVLTNFYSLMALLAFSVTPVTLVIAPTFVEVWAGEEIYAGHLTAIFMSLTFLQLAFSYPSIVILHATGRIKAKVLMSAVGGALAAGGAYLSAPTLGLSGVAAANAIGLIVTLTWFLPFAVGKIVEPVEICWQTIGRSIFIGCVVGLIFAVPSMIGRQQDFHDSINLLIGACALPFAAATSLMLSPLSIRKSLVDRMRALLWRPQSD